MTDPLFAAGTFVRLRTDTTRVGIVQSGERVQSGSRRIPVQGPDGRVRFFPEEALELVPAAPETLNTLVASGSFVAPEWLRRTLARIRVTGKLADVVYSMEATGTDFYAHQFKPVLKLLNSPTDGLLIADEVGLGKTIEAGLIWTELRARVDAERLLVLCPKTLCEKWRSELDRRFGVDARIVDAAGLLDLMSPERRSSRGFAAIASMSSLRPPNGWDGDEEMVGGEIRGARAQLARFLAEAAEDQPLLDLLVIDEAHHMRNPETLLNRLAGLANAVTSYRVFLSATPIHLRNRDLNSLLRMIDPDTFEFDGTLDRIIAANAPLIAARDRVLDAKSTVEEIIDLIDSASRYDLLSNSKALQALREEVSTRTLDRPARSDIAWRLENVNQLANYVTRTRRRDVEELRVVRRPLAPELPLADDERTFYDAITQEVTEYAQLCAGSERFLLSTPQRLVASSPAAAAAWWASYAGPKSELDIQRSLETEDEDDPEATTTEVDYKPLVARLAEKTRELGLTQRLREVDSKYALLLREFTRLWEEEPDAKLIVFSSFKATLNYLHGRLVKEGISCEIMHGSVSEPRDAILKRFKERAGRCVLLSSEVGSEGVDLQFCWIVVNYDLPWNPMRLEQRIGRVDRLGQTREQVTIINLIYADTIDRRIYAKLYERLKLGERALGEFEAVLGEPIREMTQRLLDPDLTDLEKDLAIDRAAQALENRAKDTSMLEEEAGALVQHGDFIVRQILESRQLHRWLDGEDILYYVKDRLQRSFSGVTIEAAPPGSPSYRISLPDAAREALATFLARHDLRGRTKLLEVDDRQRFQFTASVVGSRQARLESISQVHPLVRFAASLDENDRAALQPRAIAARVGAAEVTLPCGAGDYVVMIRRWAATDGAGRPTGMARLAYAGARLGSDELIGEDLAEALTTAAALHGRVLANLRADPRLDSLEELIEGTLNPELDRRFHSYTSEISADIEDRLTVRLRALNAHLQGKQQGLRQRIALFRGRARSERANGNEKKARRNESLIAATEGQLRKLERRCEQRRAGIESQRILTPEESDLAAAFVEVRKGED